MGWDGMDVIREQEISRLPTVTRDVMGGVANKEHGVMWSGMQRSGRLLVWQGARGRLITR